MKAELIRVIYPKTPADETNGMRIVEYKALENDGNVLTGTLFKGLGKWLPLAAMTYDLKGSWGESKYGLEYRVESIKEIDPETPQQIKAFLCSLKLPGVGKKKVEMIVDHFGDKAINIIEVSPQRLAEIEGLKLSAEKIDEVSAVFQEKKLGKKIFDLLSSFGLRSGRAVEKIRQVFKDTALDVIKEHPFRLATVNGVSYNMAKEIAEKQGISPFCDEGLEEAIVEAVKTATRGGDMFVILDELPRRVSTVIGQEVDFNTFRPVLMKLAKSKKRIVIANIPNSEQKAVYTTNMYNAEKSAAATIAKLYKENRFAVVGNIGEAITKYERKKSASFQFADEQREAIRTALSSPISVITGGPGTGKTAIIDAIYYIFASAFPDKTVLMCAPTGCAARRITESTGISAKTIHSALHIRPSEDENEPITSDVELDTDLIIVDEMSMVDSALFSCLVSSIGTTTRVVFIGDVDQLPSVGAGCVLNDLIQSGEIPTVKLTKIYRQKGGTTIAANAANIREGRKALDYSDPSFQFVETSSKKECMDMTKMIFETEVKAFGLNDVAVLCPYRRKNEKAINTEELNEVFREKMNPKSERKKEVTIDKVLFRVGDKVMQCRNTENTANGDTGYIMDVDYDEGNVTINFGYAVENLKINECNIVHAYATSIHKSQGQQYKTVIVDLTNQHYALLYRNLIYTAVTRATQRVIIVGEKFALDKAINTVSINKRKSLLDLRIRAEFKKELRNGKDNNNR